MKFLTDIALMICGSTAFMFVVTEGWAPTSIAFTLVLLVPAIGAGYLVRFIVNKFILNQEL